MLSEQVLKNILQALRSIPIWDLVAGATLFPIPLAIELDHRPYEVKENGGKTLSRKLLRGRENAVGFSLSS